MIELLHDLMIKVKGAVQEKNANGLFNYIMPDEVDNTVRYGDVISIPRGCDTVEIGDTVYFHHNITAPLFAMDGSGECFGSFEIDRAEGLYHCPIEECFGYERDGVFSALDPYCFVKPIKNDHVKIKNGLLTVDKNKEVPYIGILKHSNKTLRAIGLDDGDMVVFAEWSMYNYPIKGEKLYRMGNDRIIGKASYE